MRNLLTGTSFFFLFTILVVNSFAQTRFSLELGGGITYPQSSIKGTNNYVFSGGFKYSITPFYAFQLNADLGTLSGKQQTGEFTGSDLPTNFKDFSTNLKMASLNNLFNLNRLLPTRRVLGRVNPYLIAGIGIIFYNSQANRIDGKVRTFDYLAFQWNAGMGMRYYMNTRLDIFVSYQYFFTQTYYLDAIHKDLKYDYFMFGNIGVSWKIGASKVSDHIDWQDVRLYAIKKVKKSSEEVVDNQGKGKENKEEPKTSNNTSVSDTESKSENNEPKPKETSIDKSGINTENTSEAKDKSKVNLTTNKSNKEELTSEKTSEGTELKSEEKKEQIAEKVNTTKPQDVTLNNKSKDSTGTYLSTAPVTRYKPSKGILVPEGVSIEKQESKVEVQTPIKKKQISNSEVKSELSANKNVTKNDDIDADVDEVIAPLDIYNVIVASYRSEKYERRFANKLRNKGFEAMMFRSTANSNMIRVSVYSDSDKYASINEMRKIRSRIEPYAWIHV